MRPLSEEPEDAVPSGCASDASRDEKGGVSLMPRPGPTHGPCGSRWTDVPSPMSILCALEREMFTIEV